MQADVLNIQGKKTGRTVELPEEIFGIEPNDHVIYLCVNIPGSTASGYAKIDHVVIRLDPENLFR